MSPKEIEVSRLITVKCGGLPKVIAAIGKAVSGRDISSLENINSNFMDTLEEAMPELFGWMQSYFDACEDAVKPCIFYLSVFMVDADIRRGRLLRRWIAEGYSREKIGISAEKDGEKLFNELVQLSIIQEPPGQPLNDPDRNVDYVFQVNGFYHRYIISQQLEGNLVFALEGHCNLNSQRVGQHLTIRSSWDRDEIVFKSMDLSRLRSLTVFGEWRSFFISTTDGSSNMRLLRVLDLEDTKKGVTNDVLKKIGELLPRLKFLSVRGCKDITRMPESLGGLRQLQTLDVSRTKITKLSYAIIKLVKLQYLCAGTTQDGNAQPAAADPDGMSRSQAAAADHDGMSSSQAAAADPDGMSRSQAAAADHDGMSSSQAAAAEGENTSSTLVQWRRKTSDLVQSYSCSWSSKKKKQQFDNGGGVKVHAAGFGNLTALHSLGIVNVGGPGGKAILKEMEKLKQLRNLWVSGINQKNWDSLCSVVSGHGHLESLSVRLDYDESEQEGGLCSLDGISELPKTLNSLKFYGGNVSASSTCILTNHRLFEGYIYRTEYELIRIELTASTQKDIDSLSEIGHGSMFAHLCIKPIEDVEIRYGFGKYSYRPFGSATVKIECNSYKLTLVFGPHSTDHVVVLEVNCFSATESSLEISGLEKLTNLKEICLKGSYSDKLRQYLQDKVDCLESPYPSGTWPEDDNWKPVLKLEPQQSAPSTPCASLKRLFT